MLACQQAVAYVVKGSHTQLLAVSLASLVNHYQSSEALDIIVMEDMTVPADLAFLTEIPAIYGKPQITVKLVRPPQVVYALKEFDNIDLPGMIAWRLFLPHEFPSYDKILYLDNDTILYCDVTELFDQSLDGKLIGAVQDFYFYVESDVTNLNGNFGLHTLKHYVNSGVILFNVPLWTQTFTVEELARQINETTLPWPDQTLLNVLCEDRIAFMPLAYNYQKNDHWLYHWAVPRCEQTAQDIVAARQAVKLRHFIEFERFSMPWEHLHVADEFEMDFYHYLYFLKNCLNARRRK